MSPFSDLVHQALTGPDALTPSELAAVRPFFLLHHPMLEAIAAAQGSPCLCVLCRPLFARPDRPALSLVRGFDAVPDEDLSAALDF